MEGSMGQVVMIITITEVSLALILMVVAGYYFWHADCIWNAIVKCRRLSSSFKPGKDDQTPTSKGAT